MHQPEPSFKSQALVSPAAGRVGCSKLSAKFLSRNCPLPKGSAFPKVRRPAKVSLHPMTGQCGVQWGTPLQDHPAPELPARSHGRVAAQLLSLPVLFPAGVTPKPPPGKLLQEILISESKNIRKNMMRFRVRVLSLYIYFAPKNMTLPLG